MLGYKRDIFGFLNDVRKNDWLLSISSAFEITFFKLTFYLLLYESCKNMIGIVCASYYRHIGLKLFSVWCFTICLHWVDGKTSSTRIAKQNNHFLILVLKKLNMKVEWKNYGLKVRPILSVIFTLNYINCKVR